MWDRNPYTMYGINNPDAFSEANTKQALIEC